MVVTLVVVNFIYEFDCDTIGSSVRRDFGVRLALFEKSDRVHII